MISKQKQKKINELKALIFEFGQGDVSMERATEMATNYYTYKRTLSERIEDFFFNHTSISQLANNGVIAERIKQKNMQQA